MSRTTVDAFGGHGFLGFLCESGSRMPLIRSSRFAIASPVLIEHRLAHDPAIHSIDREVPREQLVRDHGSAYWSDAGTGGRPRQSSGAM